MDRHCLIMKWDYDYDKEGTWFDHDSGEQRYALTPNTVFSLPHMDRKKLEIVSVHTQGERTGVELRVDGYPRTVYSDAESVSVHVSYDYMASGDSVATSLHLLFSVGF